MIGAWRTVGSCASGVSAAALGSDGIHCVAPAGLLVFTQSNLNRLSRYWVVNKVGLTDQEPSSPLVMASAPLPLPHLLAQPSPCCSTPAEAGSGPRHLEGSCAPCALPKVWPPAMRATVSSSFMAMRPKASRMSFAAASGSGLPFGPSGLT